MDPTPVTFIERDGAGAESALAALARRAREAGLRTRLLRSRDARDLVLLMVEGDPPLDEDDARGARVWRFEDPSGADGGAA